MTPLRNEVGEPLETWSPDTFDCDCEGCPLSGPHACDGSCGQMVETTCAVCGHTSYEDPVAMTKQNGPICGRCFQKMVDAVNDTPLGLEEMEGQ